MPGKHRQGARRGRVVVGALAALGLIAASVVFVRLRFNGADLARTITETINAQIRGQVEVESVDWPLAALPGALAGDWMPVELRGVEVYDELGDLVLEAELVTAELDPHAAAFGRNDLVFRHIEFPRGGYALIRSIPNAYPTSPWDTTTVSLGSAFAGEPRPRFSAGRSGGAGMVFDLRDYALRDVTLEFAFPSSHVGPDGERLDPVEAAQTGGFYARAEGVSGEGFLYSSGADPLRSVLYYSLAPVADRAVVRVGGREIEIDHLDVTRLAQMPAGWDDPMPRDLEFAAEATTPDGARIRVDGALVDYLQDHFGGGYDVTLDAEGAGPLASGLSGGVVGGPELGARVSVTGPSLTPRIDAQVERAVVTVATGGAEPIEARIPEATAHLDLGTGEARLENTQVRTAGGRVDVAGSATLGEPPSFEVRADIAEPLDLEPYLPKVATDLLGTRLSGHARVAGTPDAIAADELDLRLGRARLHGALRYQDGHLHPGGVAVDVGRTTVAARRGAIDLVNGAMSDLEVALRSRDAGRWLARLGAPRLIRSLRATARLSGPLSSPRADDVTLWAAGVPIVGRIASALAYRDGTLILRKVDADAYGGSIAASGRVTLVPPPPRILGLSARARDIDLSQLPGVGLALSGTASATLEARGPAASPDARLAVTTSGLEIAGDAYPTFEVTAESSRDGTRSARVQLSRERGGTLDARASVAASGELTGGARLDGLLIESLAAIGGREPIAGGTVDADLELSGTARAPLVAGSVSVARAWFQEAFLGGAELNIEPAGPGRIRVRGSLFQDAARVSGTVDTTAPFRTHLTLSLHRFELDRFAPAIADRYGARGWVSGTIEIRAPLAGPENAAPQIDVRLTEAVVHLDNDDVRGRPAPLRLENRTPIIVSFDGDRATLVEEAVIAGPAGNFRLSGSASAAELDLGVRGRIAVGLLQPYLRDQFADMGGSVDVALAVTGAADSPRVSGSVNVESVEVRPAGQDAILRLPEGKIEFTNDQLAVTGLRLVVVDQYSDETAELSVAGGVKLDNFVPSLWALRISGSLGGKMLLALLPRQISTAGGAADLSLALLGTGKTPDIDGTLEFDTEHPLAFTPRGLRREIVLDRGRVKFTDQLVELEQVGGWIDDEGRLTDVSGEMSLVDWRPVDVDVTVSADSLPFRIPKTLELTLALRGVRVVGGFADGLEIAGDVLVIDGRYIQNFNPLLDELKPKRVVEESPPLHETAPVLADARLSLNVETRAFFVKNNVANIELSGGLEVSGTPAEPQLDGVVRVEGGSLKFQGVRAKFQRTTGNVTFEKYRDLGNATPTLDIRTESDYRDFSGEDHLVVLTLTGPLNKLQWDLFTTQGLNKAQTLLLIVSGRTPEEARRVIGDEPVGRSPGEFAATRTTEPPDGSLALVDQLVKDLAGDFFSLLIEDSIRNVTDLDVARLQLGTASVGFHGEKRFTRSFSVLGDLERSLRGWTWDVRGEYRLLDQVSLEGEYLQKNFDDDAEEDIQNFRVKAVWRWLIP